MDKGTLGFVIQWTGELIHAYEVGFDGKELTQYDEIAEAKGHVMLCTHKGFTATVAKKLDTRLYIHPVMHGPICSFSLATGNI